MKVDEVSQLLTQIRELSAQARSPVSAPVTINAPGNADFSTLLGRSVDAVNNLQMRAGRAAEAFERGEPGVDIAGVMVAMQKASISFQAMTQVRNRLISAYQDVMNMPV